MMRFGVVILLVLAGGFFILKNPQPAIKSRASVIEETPVESGRADDLTEANVSADVSAGQSLPVSSATGAFVADKFAGAGTATERAAFINSAITLDDPQLLARAETLANEMIDVGSAADVMTVLPLLPQLHVRQVPQERLCRLAGGLDFEIVKLKYNRIYPDARPWNSVCNDI